MVCSHFTFHISQYCEFYIVDLLQKRIKKKGVCAQLAQSRKGVGSNFIQKPTFRFFIINHNTFKK